MQGEEQLFSWGLTSFLQHNALLERKWGRAGFGLGWPGEPTWKAKNGGRVGAEQRALRFPETLSFQGHSSALGSPRETF